LIGVYRFITAQEVIEKMAQKGKNFARMTLRHAFSSHLSLPMLAREFKSGRASCAAKKQARQYE